MKFKASNAKLAPNPVAGNLVFFCDIDPKDAKTAYAEIDELNDKNIDVEAVVHRDKRSGEANSYCWVLIHKLAEKIEQDR